MRKSLLMVGIPVAVIGLGLATYAGIRTMNKTAADPFADELKAAEAAGLELAASQAAQKFALSETAPEAKPQPKTTIKKSTSGPKAVRSNAPTVAAAPEPTAANVVEEIPDLTVMAQSNAPEPSPTVVAVNPQPAPQTVPAPSNDQGPILRGGNGSGDAGVGSSGGGGGGWGIFGAVIRGGVVDGDNCDPRTDGRRAGAGRITSRMPVYNGNPQGMAGARSNPGTFSGGSARPRMGSMVAGAIGGARPRGR